LNKSHLGFIWDEQFPHLWIFDLGQGYKKGDIAFFSGLKMSRETLRRNGYDNLGPSSARPGGYDNLGSSSARPGGYDNLGPSSARPGGYDNLGPSSARPGGYDNLGPSSALSRTLVPSARPRTLVPSARPLPRKLPPPTNGYTFIQFLGSGAFGTTYLAEKEGLEYAVKRLAKEDVGQEVNALMYLKNICSMHHILCYHETFDDPSDPRYTYIVTDFKSGKNLLEYIKDNNAVIDEEFLDQLCLDILDAIRASFSLQMTHRDIHPGNIMVSFDGQKYTFTLIDWGISVIGGMGVDDEKLADFMVSDLNDFVHLITDWTPLERVGRPLYKLINDIRHYIKPLLLNQLRRNGFQIDVVSKTKTPKEIQEFTSSVYEAFIQELQN
jgi:hypothetical protein